jgi:enoyl-CoA hydratase
VPDGVRWTEHESALIVTLDRAHRKNALHFDIVEAIATKVEGLDSAAVIVLNSAGRDFCAGVDLSMTREEMERFRDFNERMLSAFARHPGPVIAAISGWAIGAGVMLALGCDLRIADGTARFALPQSRLGLQLDSRRVDYLVRQLGLARATDMLLTCEEYDASAAAAAGLVHRLAEDATASALELARKMSSWPSDGLAAHKKMLRAAAADPDGPDSD